MGLSNKQTKGISEKPQEHEAAFYVSFLSGTSLDLRKSFSLKLMRQGHGAKMTFKQNSNQKTIREFETPDMQLTMLDKALVSRRRPAGSAVVERCDITKGSCKSVALAFVSAELSGA